MPRRLSRALNEQNSSAASFHLQAKAGWMDLVEISRKSGPEQTIASAALAAVHSINTASPFQSSFSGDASRRRGKPPQSARVGSATAGRKEASDSRPTPVGGIHTNGVR